MNSTALKQVQRPARPRLVNLVRQLVNRFPPVSLYRELQAARSLVAAYDATAERRARQRRMLSGQKGGRHV